MFCCVITAKAESQTRAEIKPLYPTLGHKLSFFDCAELHVSIMLKQTKKEIGTITVDHGTILFYFFLSLQHYINVTLN